MWHKLFHVRAAEDEDNIDAMVMAMVENNIEITQYLMYFHSVCQ
jgi:hypothetical protein